MSSPPALLQDLRDRLARIERGQAGRAPPPIPLAAALDGHLPDGGLARGALHEVLASDPGAALGFCALLLGRAEGPVLWIAPRADAVWPPGLHRLGLGIDRLILAQYRKPEDGLWALEEALRCPALGGAVLQLARLDLIAARRLQLAAEAGGGLGLLLREGAEAGGAANAITRWRVAALPGQGTLWRLDLLRCRGGQPASWPVAWREGGLEAAAGMA